MAGKTKKPEDLRVVYENARRDYQQAVAKRKAEMSTDEEMQDVTGNPAEIDEKINELEHNIAVHEQAQKRVAESKENWNKRQQFVRNTAARNYRNISQAAVFGKKEVEEKEKSKFEIPDKITSEEELDAVREKMEELVEEQIKINPDLPESVQDILKDYDTYKDDPFFQELLKNEKQEGLLEKLHDSIQEQQEAKDRYIKNKKNRAFPKSADDMINNKLYEGEIGNRTKVILGDNFDELMDLKDDYIKKKQDYNKFLEDLKKAEKSRLKENQQYQNLINRESSDEMDEELRNNLVGRLNNNLKQESLLSLDEFYQEEEELKTLKGEILELRGIALLEPDFTTRDKLPKKEKDNADNLINRLIQEYNDKHNVSEPRVSNVQDYYNALDRVAELDKKIEEADKSKMPEKIGDLKGIKEMKNVIVSSGDPDVDKRLKEAIEAYSDVENSEEVKMWRKDIGELNALLKLPSSLENLGALREKAPWNYEAAKKQIDGLLNALPDESAERQVMGTNHTVLVKSLDDYLKLEEEVNSLKKGTEDYEEKYRQFAFARAMIEKKVIEPYNDRVQKGREIFTQSLNTAQKELDAHLKEKEKNLVEAAEAYNAARIESYKKEKSELEVQNKKMKDFIKKTVIQEAKEVNKQQIESKRKKLEEDKNKHKENRRKIKEVINKSMIESKVLEEDKETLQKLEEEKKESRKKLQNIKQAVNKKLDEANNDIDQSTKGVWKEEDVEYEKSKKEAGEAIKKDRKALQNIINNERKRNNDEKARMKNKIELYRKKMLNDEKSARRIDLVKKTAVEKANVVMGNVHSSFHIVLLGAELAQITGKLKGKMDALADLESQIEKNEQVISRNTESLDLEVRKKTGKLGSRISENENTIKQLKQEIKELVKDEQEKRKAIEEAKNPQIKDTDLLKEVNDLIKENVNKAATDLNMNAEAEMNEKELEAELNEFLEENEAREDQSKADDDAINKVAQILDPLFNEDNGLKVTLAIKTIETVANLAIKKINGLRGTDKKEKIGKLDLTASIKKFNDYMERDKELEFLEECVKALQLGFKEFSKYVDLINNLNNEYSANFQTSNSYLENLKNEKENFKKYREEYCKRHENATEYEARMAFEQEQFKTANETTEKKAKLYEKAEHNLKDKTDAMNTELNKLKLDREVIIKKNDKKNARRKMDLAFAKAVIKGADMDLINRPHECSSDMLNVSDGLVFLERLSGVSITQAGKEPDMDAAFDAMSRIYIDGVNAVAMIGMEEKYQQALADEEKEKQEFMEHVQKFGAELKKGLIARAQGQMNPQDYSSQVISVENENMLLSAVTVQASEETAKEEVDEINRAMKNKNADFNEFRVKASKKIEEKYKTEQRENKKDKTITELHRSRDFRLKTAESGRGIR